MLKRRRLLKFAGIGLAAKLVAIGTHSWAMRPTHPVGSTQPAGKRLIVVFLRGGLDGLSAVAPYAEELYYQLRPTIAIPQPGAADGLLKLDSQFGLHPALAPILPLWQQGSLAFVHACGSPVLSRSHFDAQDYFETGTPGIKQTADGWMNRLLAQLPDENPIEAATIGATIPRILAGDQPVANLPSGPDPLQPMVFDRPPIVQAFDQLYSGNNPLSQLYEEGKVTRAALRAAFASELDNKINNGAALPVSFATDAAKLAKLMNRQPEVQLGFMALGGWDTHVEQGSSSGRLATLLGYLGAGLATLKQELGALYADTVIVVMSEFGRTLHENGNGGTDHGYGNVIWVLGDSVKGGKVYGNWTGLDQLQNQRELPVNTDFRDPLRLILQRHLGLAEPALNSIFPGHQVAQAMELLK